MKRKNYQALANRIIAKNNCIDTKNWEWEEKHLATIEKIMTSSPSGSGIDCGTKIDLEKSTDEKLIFYCGFHHMNENGMYDGWTEHEIIVTPSLAFTINIKITGKNRNQIKEYLHDVYYWWLIEETSE